MHARPRLLRTEPATDSPTDALSTKGPDGSSKAMDAPNPTHDAAPVAPWLTRIYRRVIPERPEPSVSPAIDNALLEFASEAADPPAVVAAGDARWAGRRRALLVGATVVVLMSALVIALTRFGFDADRAGKWLSAGGEPTASLTIQTRPAGAEVLIDGKRSGTTPATLSVAVGTHVISVRYGNDERVVPLTVAAGTQMVQYFDLNAAGAPVLTGRMSVLTDPAGARVHVDGEPRGVTPLTVADLAAGPHRVAVATEGGSAERTVTIDPGSTMSVVFSLPKLSAPLGSWLAVEAPFDVQVMERDGVIGTNQAARIMIAAGRHDVVLVSAPLGYQESRRIDVEPGKTASIHVNPPKAALSVNARPWADVVIDGNSAGQTPISNVDVPIGTHQIVFRNPQFGERRQTVVVTVKGPNRVAVDFSKSN